MKKEQIEAVARRHGLNQEQTWKLKGLVTDWLLAFAEATLEGMSGSENTERYLQGLVGIGDQMPLHRALWECQYSLYEAVKAKIHSKYKR